MPSATTNCGDVTLYIQKLGLLAPKLGLLARKLTLGDPVPIGPQHKYGGSPLSHSTSTEILLQTPPISTYTTATSIVHYVDVYLAFSTSCSIAGPALSNWIFCYVVSRLANFSSMVEKSHRPPPIKAPI